MVRYAVGRAIADSFDWAGALRDRMSTTTRPSQVNRWRSMTKTPFHFRKRSRVGSAFAWQLFVLWAERVVPSGTRRVRCQVKSLCENPGKPLKIKNLGEFSHRL